MQLAFQVLSANDIDEILAFANQQHQSRVGDENERIFQSWHARWRREALEHYLKLGWSFIARTAPTTHQAERADSERAVCVGFFLAQPLLFFRGQTQSLWLEHIDAVSGPGLAALADVAVRVAREKHLQCVLVENTEAAHLALAAWAPQPLNDQQILMVKTTKG